MAVTNDFFYLDATTLATLLTAYTNCLTAIATTGASYTIGGRTFTRANATTVAGIIASIKVAQKFQAGTRITTVHADFRT